MRNPVLAKRDRARIGDAGRKAEQWAVRRLGADQVRASGAGPEKGDAKTERYLIEVKSTKRRTLAVSLEWLAKIAREAATVKKVPILSVLFTHGNGRPVDGGAWVLVPEREWRRLTRGS